MVLHNSLSGANNHKPQGLYPENPAVLAASQANAYRIDDASSNPYFRISTSGTPTVLWGSSALAPAYTSTLRKNEGSAFLLEDTDGTDYFKVDTTTGAAVMTFGNASTNPAFVFAGTGDVRTAGRLRFDNQTDPAAVASTVFVYGKSSSGTTHLFARDSAGTVHQLTPSASGGLTGTTSLTWTVNTDASAAVNEDPIYYMIGGDGVSAPNNDLVRTALTQDSSAETVALYTERNRNGAGYSLVTTTFTIGDPTSTLTTINPILQFAIGQATFRKLRLVPTGASSTSGIVFDCTDSGSGHGWIACKGSTGTGTRFGVHSDSLGTDASAFGAETEASGADAIAIGYGCVASGAHAITISHNGNVNFDYCVALMAGGTGSFNAARQIAIGGNSTGGAYTLFVGNGPRTTSPQDATITTADQSGVNGAGAALTLRGGNAGTSSGSAAGLTLQGGTGATAGGPVAVQVAGTTSYLTAMTWLANNVTVVGPDTSGTPPTATIRASNASGTNIAGGHLYIDGSRATGDAGPGDLILRTGLGGGASGSTLRGISEVARFYAQTSATSGAFIGFGDWSSGSISGRIHAKLTYASNTSLGWLENTSATGSASWGFKSAGTATVWSAGLLYSSSDFVIAENAAIDTTPRLTLADGSGNLKLTLQSNAQTFEVLSLTEVLSTNTGSPSADSTIEIPADAWMLAVETRVLTNITYSGANTTFRYGLISGDTNPDRYGNNIASTANTENAGFDRTVAADTAGTSPFGRRHTIARKIRVQSQNGTDNLTGGSVRLTIKYFKLGLATG